MGAFHSNLSYESDFTTRLLDAMREPLAARGRMLTRLAWAVGETAPDGIDLILQKTAGDFLMVQVADGKIVSNIDLKVERRSSVNLFFETHSNFSASPEYYRAGWGVTLRATKIWWAFSDSSLLVALDLCLLRDWLNELGPKQLPRLMSYHEVGQLKHVQKNVSVGRLIPFKDVPSKIWNAGFVIEDGKSLRLSRGEYLERLGVAVAAARPAARSARDPIASAAATSPEAEQA